MRKLLIILTIIFTFSACKTKEPVSRVEKDTPQTTLMYMTGTDLSYFYAQNIKAVNSAVSSKALGAGRFLIFKHSRSNRASLVEYKYSKGGCTAETLKEYEDITSLSQDAITEVVADVKEFAPADKYNLIVSGHATGWVPKDRQTDSWQSPSISGEPLDWEAMFSSSPNVTRYLGSSNDGYFDIAELQESLEATNIKFGYILFDECFMSSIEALYSLRNCCDNIIASPCEIMGNGFPYDLVLPKLFSEDGAVVDIVGACQEYLDYYTTYSFPSGCVAHTVTSELEGLAAIVKKINACYTDENVDIESLQAYERLARPLFVDLEDYILAKCEDETLREEFLEQMERAVPVESRLHTEKFYANIGVSASSANNYEAYYTKINHYSGVTTSAPSEVMPAEWEQTEWAASIR